MMQNTVNFRVPNTAKTAFSISHDNVSRGLLYVAICECMKEFFNIFRKMEPRDDSMPNIVQIHLNLLKL